MKKYWIVLSLAGVMAAPNLFAAMQITLMDNGSTSGQVYNLSTEYSYGNGGEFRAVGNSGSGSLDSIVNWSAYAATTQGTVGSAADAGTWGYGSGLAVNGNRYFQTFCTELQEEYTPGGTYTISSVGNNALYNGTGHPVPITMGVAYLYSQFAAGTLVGYNYTYGSGRSGTAWDLQNAIWTLLGEQSTPLAAWVATDLSSIANVNAAANGAFGAADLTLGGAGQNQDQLVMVVPEATTMIAGALLLLPLGASALRILRKNRMA